MGLDFKVGNPNDVFIEPFADRVKKTFAANFKDIVLESEEEAYISDELGWSGWQLLQQRSIDAVGADRIPHLLSMPAWTGCYIPVNTEPGTFEFDGETTKLDVGSLPALVNELKEVGHALGWPTDDDGLNQLMVTYYEDEFPDKDMDVQTYIQLLLTAYVAQRRRQILWVVK